VTGLAVNQPINQLHHRAILVVMPSEPVNVGFAPLDLLKLFRSEQTLPSGVVLDLVPQLPGCGAELFGEVPGSGTTLFLNAYNKSQVRILLKVVVPWFSKGNNQTILGDSLGRQCGRRALHGRTPRIASG